MLRKFLPLNVELKNIENFNFKTTKISNIDIIVMILPLEDIEKNFRFK
jgi:hypothetical protein